MKIVSLNLWNGGRLFSAVQDFLLQQAADIYFLQEAYDGKDPQFEERFQTVELLKKAFPQHHAYFAPVYLDTREKEGNIGDGQLLLSRYPFTEQKNIFLDLPFAAYDQDGTNDFSTFPSTIQKVIVDIEGKETTLINVHGPVNLNGEEANPRRQKMLEAILSELGPSSIVAGDMNAKPTNPVIQSLEKHITSVFARELTTTFNTKRKNLEKFPGYATSPVDMVFITSDFIVLRKEVPQVDVSDHLPVVVELQQH
jgi:endonuclease/exonuclease/phosphatase family metal-dependent hydrolase